MSKRIETAWSGDGGGTLWVFGPADAIPGIERVLRRMQYLEATPDEGSINFQYQIGDDFDQLDEELVTLHVLGIDVMDAYDTFEAYRKKASES